jgi:hypothetical protein
VQHLIGSVVSYPPDQESSYAQELLPDAGRPQRVMTPRADAGPAVEDCDSPPDELFHSSPKPLAGVRFGPESAPGPSGRRPEHLRDMLACSRRRAVNRLQHALGDMQDMALTGKLPECWDWILNSRLVFLTKKSGLKPRPVRVGELWRRVIAKRALHKHLPRIRQVMLEAHQYGVAIPGGAEILVHARRVLEECIFFFYACGGHGNRSLQRSAGGGWKRWLRAGRKGETRALRRPHTTCVETPVENSQGSWEGASVTNEYTTCRQATHTLCVAASMWTDWPPRAHQCRDAVLTCIVTGGGWREGREERAIAPNPCTSPRPCL